MDINGIIEAFYGFVSEKFKTSELALDYFRHQLEPFIFHYLIQTYGEKLDAFWKTHTFPIKSERAWVIVERRIHPNMWFILRNLAWAGPNMSLYIYCSDYNIEYIRGLLGDKVNTVHLIQVFSGVGTKEQGKSEYQIVFKKADFYREIDAEYMIRIEMDCFLRRKIPDYIFTTDFYGAPWAWYLEKPGGGGLSVRRVATMIELCDKLKDYNTVMEDGWFSEKIVEHGYTFPDVNFRANVFSENFPVEDPIGVHQFWTFPINFNIKDKGAFKANVQRYLTLKME